MASDKEEVSSQREEQVLPTTNPEVSKSEPAPRVHAAVYVFAWIALSSSVIIFNKWILHTKKFEFPIFLTTWHLTFATVITQILARFTTVLDSRKKVPMTGRVYIRAILPIGVLFSMTLISGNMTYLYLSVAFIQMLKATTPVVVLFMGWAFRLSEPNIKTFLNVSIIVVGVVIASFGEIQFVLIGFIYQVASLFFEAARLTLLERLLSGAEFKMDPLVSLYYFAPACAIMNSFVLAYVELPTLTMTAIYDLGLWTLLANATMAFMLNVSVVMLIGRTSSLAMTLCGVLKDILLVFASILLFRDPVTLVQAFGYSLALIGLIIYKLGFSSVKEYANAGYQALSNNGTRSSLLKRFAILGGAIIALILLITAVAPRINPEYSATNLQHKFSDFMIDSKGGTTGN